MVPNTNSFFLFNKNSNSPIKRKLNFSQLDNGNVNEILKPENISPKYYPINTCGNNTIHLNTEDNYYIRQNSYFNKNQTGNYSTKNTSSNLYTDDNVLTKRDKFKKSDSGYTMNFPEVKDHHHKSIVNTEIPTNRNIKIKQISNLSYYVKKNSPSSSNVRSPSYRETVFCNSEAVTTNVSKVYAKKMYEWLNSLGLSNYYNNFLEKGFLNIEKIIENMNDINARVTYKDIESLDIRKSGHIFRILVKLEFDAKLIDENLYFIIFNNINKNSISSCNLKISQEKYVCCGIGNTITLHQRIHKESERFNFDLIPWLKQIHLPHLRKNFIFNGFDSMEYFILQMFSSYPITDEILEECLHIYNRKERRTILNQLTRDIKAINIKLFDNSIDNKYLTTEKNEDTRLEGDSLEIGCKMCNIF
jgi:hypothetical protein